MAIQHALAALVLAATGSLVALSQARLPGVHGEADSLADHRGHPVVVMVINARRLGTVRPWAQDLVGRYPQLQLLTVADVDEQRPTTVQRVAAVLARRVPADAVVLIDMERLWARELELDTAAPNLVLVDADGAIVGRFRGRWNERLSAEVASAVGAMVGSA